MKEISACTQEQTATSTDVLSIAKQVEQILTELNKLITQFKVDKSNETI